MYVSRRHVFLGGVSALAITIAIPAQTFRGIAATPTYQGSPNIAITAIDTSGGIELSRTSGRTPAFVQVAASKIIATGTSRPYEDLEYRWDFGDPAGKEIFANPATGATVNTNSDQVGPEAAYVYRTNGRKTITLKIKGKNGDGFTTAICTATFTVSDFPKTNVKYYDSAAKAGGNGSLERPYNNLSTLSKWAFGSTETQLLLKRGSEFVDAGFLNLFAVNLTGLRMAAYGAGADPIIKNSLKASVRLANGSASRGFKKDDLVISNIKFIATGKAHRCVEISSAGNRDTKAANTNVYFDHCEFTGDFDSPRGFTNIVIIPNTGVPGGLASRMGLWGGVLNTTRTSLSRGMSIYSDIYDWFFMVGQTDISGDATNATYEHHIYPNVSAHGLFRWIKFGAASNRNFCLNLNWNTIPVVPVTGLGPGDNGMVRIAVSDSNYFKKGGYIRTKSINGSGSRENANGTWIVANIVDRTHIDLQDSDWSKTNPYVSPGQALFPQNSQYWLIDGCDMTGALRSYDAGNEGNHPEINSFNAVVVQNCIMHGLRGYGVMQAPCLLTLTHRDNNMWNCLTYHFGPTANRGTSLYMYRNKSHVTATDDGEHAAWRLNNGARPAVWTAPQQFTDNEIYDARSVAKILTFTSLQTQVANGSIIDRNVYYAPNSTYSLYENLTPKTFANWKAALARIKGDANSTYGVDPCWRDPARGDFSKKC